jgi:transposase
MSASTWSPTHQDELIYHWVKLEGRSQSSVAEMLGISQPTVSRVIQRYERWQAHAADREGGRLDHSERLRAQRWLTFERNEILLASCLRLAQEMEGFTDVSKSTIERSQYGGEERQVRTQHSTIDRSGIAARFIRLAFRINMEQHKLASLDPPPPANPLTPEDLAEINRPSPDEGAAPSFSPKPQAAAETPVVVGSPDPVVVVGSPDPTTNSDRRSPGQTSTPTPTAPLPDLCAENKPLSPSPTLPLPLPDSHSPPPPVNNLNNPTSPESNLTLGHTVPCTESTPTRKKSTACITPCSVAGHMTASQPLASNSRAGDLVTAHIELV